LFLIIFFFFFSSRRRHTRLQGDWSSDVCSSDLVMGALILREGAASILDLLARAGWVLLLLVPLHVLPLFPDVVAWRLLILERPRSEERRVGKECRSRWWAVELREAWES